MTGLRSIWQSAVAVTLLVSTTATGDVVRDAVQRGAPGTTAGRAIESVSRASPAYVDWLLGQPLSRAAVAPQDRTATAAPPVTPVVAAPAPPGSLTLVLSAAASLGALHGVRSIKRLQLSALPDWYHTGAPRQIGPATPLDLEPGALPACAFAVPVLRPSRFSPPREPQLRPRSAVPVLVRSPRAPPAYA